MRNAGARHHVLEQLGELDPVVAYKAAGGNGDRTETLIANLGNAAICEALAAIADDHEDPMRVHIKHCGKLFDAARVIISMTP